MRVTVIAPTHPFLAQNVVDYFIIFQKDDNKHLSYHTFPNINTCLALYQQGGISQQKDKNINAYIIQPGGPVYCSRLWGFHERPLQVHIKRTLRQVCINFKPGVLRYFTAEHYETLLSSYQAFEHIFGYHQPFLLEQLFAIDNPKEQALLLEHFLLRKYQGKPLEKPVRECLHYIARRGGDIRIQELAAHLNIHPSTLFRQFHSVIGQSPKTFIKTYRFRSTLSALTSYPTTRLTPIGHQHHYYDQAHFIKDFKQLAGTTPKLLQKQLTVLGKQFAWSAP